MHDDNAFDARHEARGRCAPGSTVLSEIPHEFADAIAALDAALNESKKANGLPDRNSEYFLYQTLIGAWPIDAERTKAVHAEGDARGQAADDLDGEQQGVRRRAERLYRRDSGEARSL